MEKYILIKDAIGFAKPSSPKGKIVKDPQNMWIPKTNKLEGSIVYLRTADGFKKMLQSTKAGNYKYIDADSIKLISEPIGNIASNAGASTTSSFNGLEELTNSGELDNFSGKWIVNVPTKNPPSKGYNGGRGYGNKGEEQSNTIGDWFKETFGGQPSDKEKIALADPNKVVYTPEEAAKLHAASGSKTPFKEWVTKDSTITFLTSLANLGAGVLLNKNQGAPSQTGVPNPTNTPDAKKDEKDEDEKTILGMHPVTFTIVTVGTLVLIIGSVLYFGRKGASATPKIAVA